MGRAPIAVAACALALALALACGGGSEQSSPSPIEPPITGPKPPVTHGSWTYYGTAQGLSEDVHDVSADEGGNVYVAGWDALYAKTAGATSFSRFDAARGGLTESCNEESEIGNEVPSTPFRLCPVVSVAGASPGKAIVGYQGFGNDANWGAWWALAAGGADVVAFDPAGGTLARTRHVFIASPPHVVCGGTGEDRATSCEEDDYWWTWGRRLFRTVRRIVVNHDAGSPLYGDVWMAGDHATFAALLAGADARGLVDRTAGFGPLWSDAKGVWEHLHPNVPNDQGWFINGEAWALSLDPRDGTPWGSNGYRTVYVVGYGPDLAWDLWGMGPWPSDPDVEPFIDVWPDPVAITTASAEYEGARLLGETADQVISLSHCPDGTVWIGSLAHGLARIDPDGDPTRPVRLSLPDLPVHGNAVSAVACDPSDGSLWIGLRRGGIMRLRDGAFELAGAPAEVAFARQPVQSIQIDRWSSPRVVYFAFRATKDARGVVVQGGGVAAYDGE